ncbi:hypothetical protein PFNF135_02143 [Plasmodium falciparum NF135/5.C10]|uniref:Surface antigen n=1 Tax=Plasmodium falciparum NF135/5.C10 TaxID=1036726 RepID=W4IHP7_PLAFA|nr:hypothetical protein PFNF135_02143 [Plasmodium falciparum NF135/5.C10]
MKVHYINILLFALPLNILFLSSQAHNKNKPSITPHTPKIPSTRLLCECDLYMPNYDSDPEMKSVMENFNEQTQHRFHEYDDRMKEKRQKCKEQCDKEIQKIILKDKLEKQMEQQLITLETKIDTGDIPTCICEKSLADKTEKFCLNCGINVGGGVTLSSGVLGEIGEAAISAWKTTEIAAATKAAIAEGAAKGLAAGEAKGMQIVIGVLKSFGVEDVCPEIFKSILKMSRYTDVTNFGGAIATKYKDTCTSLVSDFEAPAACEGFEYNFGIFIKGSKIPGPPANSSVPNMLNLLVDKAKLTATDVTKTTTKEVTKAAIETSKKAIEATSYNWYTTIAYSIIAIVVIVLIMVIIYLILRYRRKKKMKKKLQYIKLLKE